MIDDKVRDFLVMSDLDRIQELRAYGILDTLPEKEFDDIVELAATICQTPIAQISLIDTSQQWIKASFGLECKVTPREHSFCSHSLEKPNEILEIEDSHYDLRFKNNPLVTGKPNIRFYAGMPLRTPTGNVLGTLCVIDTVPKKLSLEAKRALRILADKVMEYFEARKGILDLQNQLRQSVDVLQNLTSSMEAMREKALVGSWSWNKDDRNITWSDELKTLIGIEATSVIPEETNWRTFISKSDLINLIRGSIRSADEGHSTSIIHKVITSNKKMIWLETQINSEKNSNNEIVIVTGTCVDITLRKNYNDLLEDILFTISHTIRRPVSTLQGLINLLVNHENMTQETILEYAELIRSVTDELDNYTRHVTVSFLNRRK